MYGLFRGAGASGEREKPAALLIPDDPQDDPASWVLFPDLSGIHFHIPIAVAMTSGVVYGLSGARGAEKCVEVDVDLRPVHGLPLRTPAGMDGWLTCGPVHA